MQFDALPTKQCLEDVLAFTGGKKVPTSEIPDDAVADIQGNTTARAGSKAACSINLVTDRI